MNTTVSTLPKEDLAQFSVKYLKGVGPQLAKKLEKKGIFSVQDLLFHLPSRYLDRTRITPLRDVRVGEYVVIEGVITQSKILFAKKRMLRLSAQDGSGQIGLVFFHFNAQQQTQLSVGERIRCFGEVRISKLGIQMIHPEYRIIKDDISPSMEETLTPVYPTTDGISQTLWRKWMAQALILNQQKPTLIDYLPETVREALHFPTLQEAIAWCHCPPVDVRFELLEQGAYPAQRRLVFEELLAYQLGLLKLRANSKQYRAPRFTQQSRLIEPFLSQLPFALTRAQQRVFEHITHDLQSDKPMLRLVQGDVGSGKTVVAILALLCAVESGYQGVLMAPTEILAQQHYVTLSHWLAPLGIKIGYLSGKQTLKQKEAQKEKIKNHEVALMVGTHALFQEEVEFHKLGLVVIDEQHRFGVHQRLALRAKGDSSEEQIHQLIMTATPIPRTLAMTAYSHLDCSVIDELPPGRVPITTVTIPNTRREEVIARLTHTFAQSQQAYWVCTLIEESEELTLEAAEKTFELLQQSLPHISIGLIHGRMKNADKEQVMQGFKQGSIQLLVATLVIEVGVDVPNATIMIIENPERLGLAQLHQLRGRVGRGSHACHCVLLYGHPLSQQAKERLMVLRESTDGFTIAQKDLELRGPGEVLGTRQTGLVQFKMANLVRDQDLLEPVRECAQFLLEKFPKEAAHIIRRFSHMNEQYTLV